MFSNIDSLGQVMGVATNMEGNIGWGVKGNGKSLGSVFLADYMGNSSATTTLTSDFDGIIDLTMEDHAAYVIDSDSVIWKFKYSGN